MQLFAAQSKKRGTIVRQNSPELAANPMAGNRTRSGMNKTRSPLSSANNAQRSRVHARDITNQVVGKDRRSPSSSPEEQVSLQKSGVSINRIYSNLSGFQGANNSPIWLFLAVHLYLD